MDFYFRFVVPNRSLIEIGRTEAVMEEVTEGFNRYVSGHWENLCRKSVSGQLIMGKRYGLASRWWGSISRDEQIEIDVVAESVDGKSILVGECKWSENDPVEPLFKKLTDQAGKLPFIKNKVIVPVLFLKGNKKTGENILFPEHVIELL
jgi:AAA+ ATPase superfamily predicted ATPase